MTQQQPPSGGNKAKRRNTANKPSFVAIPPMALVEVGMAFADGSRKYGGKYTWRDVNDPPDTDTYLDAALRHIFLYMDGSDADADSGLHPLAHAVASLLIILDSYQKGILDDRRVPPPVISPTQTETTNE